MHISMKALGSIVAINFGFVKATINEALEREDLRQGIIDFIKDIK